MKWLRGRLRGANKRPAEAAHARPDEPSKPPAAPRPNGRPSGRPRLMLLVPDAAAIDAYRLHSFESAGSAEAFVRFWFPSGLERGILAFWASHQKPDPEGESVVLIRDSRRPDLAYPFSYSDMATARAWLMKELAQGLSARQVLLYWATPVHIIRETADRVRLEPAEPPSPAPPPAQEEPAPALTTEPPEPVPEAEPPAKPEPRPAAPWRVLSEIDEIVQAAWTEQDEPPEDRPLAEENEPLEDPPLAEEPAPPEDRPAAEQNEPLEDPPLAEEATEEPRETLPKSRWEQREGPFRGFGSPPGKF